MPDTGIWSAIATSFATFSSFLLMLIQRQNFAESIRPELVLIGWTRSVEGEGNAAHDVIAFQTIKNVGRGAAFNIMLGLKAISDNSFDTPHEPLEAMFGTTRLPYLSSE
jgi:hypothetical protein